MISRRDFPGLTELNHRVTSPRSPEYNCIAWAAEDLSRWWEPGRHWPTPVATGDYGIAVLEAAFRALRYETCEDGALEPGFQKVALYGSFEFYTHAARQLPDGRWTSKLGRSEDIEHETPDVIAGGLYGEVVQFLKRADSRSIRGPLQVDPGRSEPWLVPPARQ